MKRIGRTFLSFLATLVLGTSLLAPAAIAQHEGHKTMPAKKKAATKVMYKAKCGMMYTPAQAKKHKYICPHDKKPLKKVMVRK